MRNNDDALGYTLTLSSGHTPSCFILSSSCLIMSVAPSFSFGCAFATFLIIFAVAIVCVRARERERLHLFDVIFLCQLSYFVTSISKPLLLLPKRQMIVSVICFYFVAFPAANRPYYSGERKKLRRRSTRRKWRLK